MNFRNENIYSIEFHLFLLKNIHYQNRGIAFVTYGSVKKLKCYEKWKMMSSIQLNYVELNEINIH